MSSSGDYFLLDQLTGKKYKVDQQIASQVFHSDRKGENA